MKNGGVGRVAAALVISGIFAAIPARAAQLGGQAGSFSRIGLGPERVAMGDCGTALTGAGMSWFYNPAATSLLKERQASLGYRFLSLDRELMYIGVSSPLKGHAAVAFGFVRGATDNIDARDSNGERFDILSASDNLIHATFSLNPHPMVALGVSLKWLIASIPDILDDDKTLYAYGMGIDLGARVSLRPNLAIGIQARDINAKYSWDATDVWNDGTGAKDDAFPTLIRFGAAYDPRPDVTITSDLIVNAGDVGSSSEAFDLHAGGEWRTPLEDEKNLALRAGWNGSAPSFGLGLDLKLRKNLRARFDYAYIFEKVAPSGSHLIGWIFSLD